jgi:serine/threonine protein kinase
MQQQQQLKLDAVDMSALSDIYTIDGVLGEGTFGIVFRAKHRQTGAWYAIKKLRLDGHTEGVPATAIREVTLLQDLSTHPNIVKLLQVVCRKHRVYLVFELMTEDLRSYLHRARKALPPNFLGTVLPIPMVKQLTRQILDALWSCHHNRILHRDLKPGNLLLQDVGNGQLRIKLADFGLARTFELPLVTYTNEVVTLWYRSPEILLGEKHYTPSVDIWSVGCILVEMLTGIALFRGESQLDQVYKIFGVLGTPTEETWPGVTSLASYSSSFPSWRPQDLAPLFPAVVQQTGGIELIRAMLQLNPKQRPTAGELLKHPWLQLEG